MPKKSLGQHFLRCRWVVSTLLKAAELTSDDMVLEIGPGTGILTKALSQKAKEVVAVEKDERLAKELSDSFKKEGINNIKIVEGDFLRMFSGLFRSKIGTEKYKVVANIPYYLTSRLLKILLEKGPRPNLIVLTIQKEVAQRITAKPPKMNLLALSIQAFGRPEIIKTVPASCFWPKPKVDSAIIKITGISDDFFRKNGLDAEQFFQAAKAAFGQKRKLLTNTLSKIAPKEEIERALTEAGVNPKARPEELSLNQWAKIVLGISKNRR